jgi:predicted DNA-binding transcriptional regulator AlpA
MLTCKCCASEIDLVGTKEAGQLLGVSSPSFQSLKLRADFPAPATRLGQGALWYREDLLAWKAGRESRQFQKELSRFDSLPDEWRTEIIRLRSQQAA